MKLLIWFIFILVFSPLTMAAPIPATSSSMILSHKKELFLSKKGFKIHGENTNWKHLGPSIESPNIITMYQSPKKIDGIYPALTVRYSRLNKKNKISTYIKKWKKDYSRFGFNILLGKKVLPEAKKKLITTENLQHYRDVYGIDGRIFEVVVNDGSDLAGLKLGQVETRGRSGWILGIKNGGNVQIIPPQDAGIEVGSILAIMGARSEVEGYAEAHQLTVRQYLSEFSEALNPTTAGIAEIVITPDSDLIGRTISEADIRRRYGMRVLALYRVDQVIDEELATLNMQAGDTLVVHSRWQDMIKVSKDNKFAVVTDFPKEEFRPNKLRNASLAFFLALGLVLFSDLPLSLSLMTGAIGMVIGRVLHMEEAYNSVSWQTVFLLACLIPLGLAMEQSGAAQYLAFYAVSLMDGLPVWVIQLFLAVIATIFTLVMSNVGATVLLVPLAIQVALGVGADPAIFALTVALSTSNSFLIPTHQVNALIMGPAGYSVRDFMRAGIGMTVLFLCVMLIMLNLFY